MQEPGEQLTLKEAVEQIVESDPRFNQGGVPVENVSLRNPDGYNPANVPNDQSAQQWAEQYGAQPPASPPQEPQRPLPPRDEEGKFTKLYAGKYKSPDELENAYMNQFSETQRLNERLKTLEAAQALMQQVQPFRSREPERPQPIPVQQDASANLYVAPDQINSLVDQRAGEIARQQIQEFMGPILRGNQAITTLRNTYPEYAHNEPEFSKWLTVNPELSRRIAANPDADLLMEGAYLKFRSERSATLSTQNVQTAQQANPQLQQARQHAGPTQGSRNDVPEETSRARQLVQLRQLMQSGDEYTRKRAEQAYQRLRLEEANVAGHVEGNWGR